MQLSPTTPNATIEGAPTKEHAALYLERFPMEQLYIMQWEGQQEIQYREERMHDELQMMEVDLVHYIELCVSLKRENEEISEECKRLKTTVKEVMTVVTEEEFDEDQPLEARLTNIKEVVQE